MKSLDLVESEEWRRKKLIQLIVALKQALQPLRWKLMPSDTPIQPLIVGDNDKALQLSESLRERGILVPAIRPPTVPQGASRLRISLSSAHDMEDVARLGAVLRELDVAS
jgi:8-amino-7-oxononanoate synthase